MKDVRALHKKAIELTEQLWKTLARKKGGGGRRRRHRARGKPRKANQVHPEAELQAVAPGGAAHTAIAQT